LFLKLTVICYFVTFYLSKLWGNIAKNKKMAHRYLLPRLSFTKWRHLILHNQFMQITCRVKKLNDIAFCQKTAKIRAALIKLLA